MVTNTLEKNTRKLDTENPKIMVNNFDEDGQELIPPLSISTALGVLCKNKGVEPQNFSGARHDGAWVFTWTKKPIPLHVKPFVVTDMGNVVVSPKTIHLEKTVQNAVKRERIGRKREIETQKTLDAVTHQYKNAPDNVKRMSSNVVKWEAPAENQKKNNGKKGRRKQR